MKLWKQIRCFVLGCAGHVDRETDEDGIEWIGLRCVTCGQLRGKFMSAYQTRQTNSTNTRLRYEAALSESTPSPDGK